MTILAHAQRLIGLDAGAAPGPWFDAYSTHGDPYVCTDQTRWAFTQICATDKGYGDYGRGNNRFIAAARTSPDVAKALIEAVKLIERLREKMDWFTLGAEQLSDDTRAFLASLTLPDAGQGRV